MRAPKERFDFVHEFLSRVFGDALHAKRILSLTDGTLGVMTGAALAVSLIGQALATARGLIAKSAIKQVDRLLLNAFAILLLTLLGAAGESLKAASGEALPRRHIAKLWVNGSTRKPDANFCCCLHLNNTTAFRANLLRTQLRTHRKKNAPEEKRRRSKQGDTDGKKPRPRQLHK